MLETVEGFYTEGKVVLKETPPGMKQARVLVTFLLDEESRTQGRMMEYGKYAGELTFTEDDFKTAEWRGETEEPDATYS